MHRAGLTSHYRIVRMLLPMAVFALVLAGFAQVNAASASSGAGGGNEHFHMPNGIRPHVFKTRQVAMNDANAGQQGRFQPTPSDLLKYYGGPVMQSGSTTYAIFWEPATLQDGKATSVSPTYNSLLQRYFSDVGGSGLYNVVTQYYDKFNGHILNNSTFGGAWVDTSPYPASGCTDSATPKDCLTDAQIQAEVTHAMSVNGWTSGMNHMFFVFTSKGEGSCFDSNTSACAFTYYCAYHSAFNDSKNNPVIYANMPYTGTNLTACGVGTSPNNDFDADSTINVTSHEHMEAVTDPLLNAWFDYQFNEIGDKCEWNFGTVSLNNNKANEQWKQDYYIVQQEWSNAIDGCTQGVQGDQLVGTLYTVAKDGTIYAINTSDTTLRWRYQTLSRKSITTSPVVTNNVVYFGSSDHYIYAFNATSGALLWKALTGGVVESMPTVANNIVYAGSDDGMLYALNTSKGSQVWRYQMRRPVTAPPVVANNVVYVGAANGNFYALNAGNGKLLWQYSMRWPISGQAFVLNGVVYVGSNDGTLYGLDASKGKLLWQYRLGSLINGSFTVSNGVLYAGALNGYLYAFNLSTKSLLWKYSVGSSITSAPVAANNAIYVPALNGYLYAIDASKGKQLWKYAVGGLISGSPAAIDVAVYVGTINGYLYALNPAQGSQIWKINPGSTWLSPAVQTLGY
jgi:outer membrane protein assembly factor BamB